VYGCRSQPEAGGVFNLPLHPVFRKTDAEKLQYLADQIPDLPKALKFITDVIDQIEDDQQTKELLRSMVQDEMSSGQWLLEANDLLNGTNAAA